MHKKLTRDKLRSVRKLLRKLLVLILAAWLPLFTGAALASVVCKDAAKAGHVHVAEQGTNATDGATGAADDCGGCDLCYSHCTLWLPVAAHHLFVPAHGTIAWARAAPLISVSFPPADRPPLSRLG